MGRQVSKHKRRLAEEDEETVREDYVKKMRDSYPLIIRTLMQDLIVSIDKDGNIVFLNDAAVEFWGKPSEEIIGTNFADHLRPEDIEKAQVALQEMIKSKGQVKGFITQMEISGETRKVAWNGVAVFDDDGNYIGAQATGKDLTEFLRTEEELKWSRRHFQRLFEVLVDPVVIVDMNGKILELSQSAEEILGFQREEFVGRHFMEIDVTTDKSKALMLKNLERMKKGKYISPYTIEVVAKDGKKLLYELTPAKLMYKTEPAILGIFHNITEQKRVEEKLRASEERFKYFLENAPEAIWVQDTSGIFLDGNKRAEELTGYKREELIGKNMLETLVSPESVTRLLETFKPTKLGEISGPNEVEMIKKDGSRIPVEASTIPIQRDEKINIIGIARDIADRKKAEEAIKEANRLLKKSNEELENYTYAVSHDLKAPLRTIKSFGSFLLEDYEDKLDETGQDYLNRMVKASSHMDAMIEDLLVLSRVGRQFTEIEKVDLNKLLKEILADLEATIKERSAEVVVDKLPTLSIHRVWKRQLFMNLISNALKFNESKKPKIEVLYGERDNDHLFKVRDNGIGIEEKYLDRIFNLFERAPTEKKYEGTGAGLAICKKIVEQHGGKIWVESTPGKGSTFLFNIPKEVKQAEEA